MVDRAATDVNLKTAVQLRQLHMIDSCHVELEHAEIGKRKKKQRFIKVYFVQRNLFNFFFFFGEVNLFDGQKNFPY